jgi:membrane associated rhomboid family serine protease
LFPLRDDRPTYTAPIVTTLLILACALVFIFELLLDDYSLNHFIAMYGIVPARLRLPTLFTSMFLHSGWSHIIGNMLFLWAFGKSLEDAMGHSKFLGFYLSCGVISALIHVLFNFYSRVPTIGASGAIAGVMGAYLLKFPRANIRTLVFIIIFVTTVDIPAALLLIYWFILQLSSGFGAIANTQVTNAGVAWFAHIGGFLAGMGLIQFFNTRTRYYRRRDIYWN